jgi:hypothetical protein
MRRAIVAAFLMACGVARPAPSAGPAIEDWVSEEQRAPPSVRIAASPTPPIRTPRERPLANGRPVDARFQDAPLEAALRILAEAANLNLVVGEGVTGTVTVDLRGIPPIEAMHALAEAHGVSLELVGRTVIARGRL